MYLHLLGTFEFIVMFVSDWEDMDGTLVTATGKVGRILREPEAESNIIRRKYTFVSNYAYLIRQMTQLSLKK